MFKTPKQKATGRVLILDHRAHLLKTFNCAKCKCQEGLDVIAYFTKLKNKWNEITPIV